MNSIEADGEVFFTREAAFWLLSCIGLVWYTALWSIGLLGCYQARKRYRWRPRSPLASAPSTSVPGVTILRPLKGLDTNLYENLESTMIQEYPAFEILFCVAEEQDQAVKVVNDLMAKYPGVNARLIIGEETVGINPKINNLIKGYRQASYDILWVIDSNVCVHPGTLGRSVDSLTQPSPSGRPIGLVHHVPYAAATESTLASRIEEAFLSTNHAKMYIAINTVAVDSCVVGKSNMYRRSDLEKIAGATNSSSPAGLSTFGKYLAEDNAIAHALWHKLDMRHSLSCDTVRNVVGRLTLWDYVWRRVRWIRVRKHMVLAATLVEPFTEGVLLSLIGCTSLSHLFGISPWFSLIIHWALWVVVDLDVYASLAGHPVPSSTRWEFMWGWCMREILAFPIWLLAITGDTVDWRGQQYRIIADGVVEPVKGKQLRS